MKGLYMSVNRGCLKLINFLWVILIESVRNLTDKSKKSFQGSQRYIIGLIFRVFRQPC